MVMVTVTVTDTGSVPGLAGRAAVHAWLALVLVLDVLNLLSQSHLNYGLVKQIATQHKFTMLLSAVSSQKHLRCAQCALAGILCGFFGL
jgi:hypothetical protein